MLISLMGQNVEGATPSQEELATWADTYGITHPVLADPNFTYSYSVDTDYTLAMPSATLLAPGAVIKLQDEFGLTGDDIEPYLPL